MEIFNYFREIWWTLEIFDKIFHLLKASPKNFRFLVILYFHTRIRLDWIIDEIIIFVITENSKSEATSIVSATMPTTTEQRAGLCGIVPVMIIVLIGLGGK